MTIHIDSKLSLDIIQYLGEVVAEVSADGMIHDVRMRNVDKYPGEEERYRGNKLSDIHPAEVAGKFTSLIRKALKTTDRSSGLPTALSPSSSLLNVTLLPLASTSTIAGVRCVVRLRTQQVLPSPMPTGSCVMWNCR